MAEWSGAENGDGDGDEGVSGVIDGIQTTSGRLRGIALASVLTLLLAACGGESPADDADQPAVDQAVTEVSIDAVDASPAVDDDAPAVDAPEEITTVGIVIEDGALEPATVQVMTGEEFSLTITNDATARDFAITEVVDGTNLAANASQQIDVTAPAAPGEFTITLDGEEAGTLEVQDAAGID